MHLYTISRLTQDIQNVLYMKMWNTLWCFNFTMFAVGQFQYRKH